MTSLFNIGKKLNLNKCACANYLIFPNKIKEFSVAAKTQLRSELEQFLLT